MPKFPKTDMNSLSDKRYEISHLSNQTNEAEYQAHFIWKRAGQQQQQIAGISHSEMRTLDKRKKRKETERDGKLHSENKMDVRQFAENFIIAF